VNRLAPPASLFDGLADAVIGWDADRRIVSWNRSAEQTYGYSRAEALGRRPAELLCTHFPVALTDVIETLAQTGRWSGDLVQHAKDGREVIVESRWLAEYDGSGRVVRATSVDRDITADLGDGAGAGRRLRASAERELLEDRLHSVQRLESVGRLAGGIAHDFNNMLAIIINYAALVAGELDALALTSGDPERWSSMSSDLEEIRVAADRAARLTHELLVFSRRDLVNPAAIDLGDTVREVEELLRRTLGEHIRFEIVAAEGLAAVLADPTQIDHALLNLAVNSRDAMPGGGTLTIDTANVEIDQEYAAPRPELLPGSYVRLRVTDTGAGMAPDVLKRAFEPFFTTKPVGEGTGLGLATVFGIVRRARGRAEFFSEPGVGTTFSALFPVAEAEFPPSPRPAGVSPAVETVLLVEDERALREATQRILTAAGYRVLAAPDGAAAIADAAASENPIDLVLTDLVMPGMRGEQLAVKLRERRPSLRVLYMSGFARGHLGPVMGLDAAELIEKPFTTSQLLERIATLAPPQA
jgi:PAS domain S-box-containing protein